MSLDDDVMKQMQEIYQQKFEDSIYDKVPNDLIQDSGDDHAPMKLVDQKCWCKITYIYGVIGPEIMFFCQDHAMMSSQQLPDLDPISVSIR